MAKLEITATLEKLSPMQTFASGFTKQVGIFTENPKGRYPNPLKIEFKKDKIALLDGVKEGDEVTLSCYLEGNEHQGKHYLCLAAFQLNGGV